MPAWLGEFWKDERGSLLLTEWVFVATILLLGILCTAVSIRSRVHHLAVDENLSNEISLTLSSGTKTAD
jgi:hypothetical protein